MMPCCAHERTVLEAVLDGRWPSDASEDLHMHVQDCRSCAEVAEIATAFREEARGRLGDVPLPSSGQVWWRAAIRARFESSRRAATPISWAQSCAAACAAGAALALTSIAAPSLWEQAGRAAGVLAGLDEGSMELAGLLVSTVARSLPLMLAVAAAVVITPIIVLYVALSDD